jgi:hypothetical protein
MACTAAEASV